MSVSFARHAARPTPAPLLPSALVVALALTGALLSGELLRLHDPSPWTERQSPSTWLWSLCGDAGADCAETAASSWSELTLPYARPTRSLTWQTGWARVPVAFIGLAYFVGVAAWFTLGGWPARWRRRWRQLIGWTAAAAAAASLLLVALMLFGAAETCRLCMLTHGVGLLLAAVMLWSTWRPVWSRRLCGWRQALPILALITLLVGGLWRYRGEQLAERTLVRQLLVYRDFVREDLQQDPAFLLREFDALPVEPQAVDADADANQPQLLLFTSLTCPACYCFDRQLAGEILPALADGARFTRRYLPRDPNAAPARAVYAAGLQGDAGVMWRMHAQLSNRRGNVDDAVLRTIALELGLDDDRLLQDLDSPRVRAALAKDRALAERLDVRATPTVFVNGRRLPSLLQTSTFWEALATRSQEDAPPLVRRAQQTERIP